MLDEGLDLFIFLCFFLLLLMITSLVFCLFFVIFSPLFFSFSFAFFSSSTFVSFLPAGLELVIDTDLFKVVVGQEKGKVILAVAPHTKDVFIFLLGEGRVLRIYIFHDVGNFLRIQASVMLKPDNSTMNSTVVAIRTYLRGKFFEKFVIVINERTILD